MGLNCHRQVVEKGLLIYSFTSVSPKIYCLTQTNSQSKYLSLADFTALGLGAGCSISHCELLILVKQKRDMQ